MRQAQFESDAQLDESQGGTWEIAVPSFWIEPWWESEDTSAPLLIGNTMMLETGIARCLPPLASSSSTSDQGEFAGFTLLEITNTGSEDVLIEARRTTPEGKQLQILFRVQGGTLDDNRELLRRMLANARVVTCAQ